MGDASGDCSGTIRNDNSSSSSSPGVLVCVVCVRGEMDCSVCMMLVGFDAMGECDVDVDADGCVVRYSGGCVLASVMMIAGEPSGGVTWSMLSTSWSCVGEA